MEALKVLLKVWGPPDMVVYTCDPSSIEEEAGGWSSCIQGQPGSISHVSGIQSESLSQNSFLKKLWNLIFTQRKHISLKSIYCRIFS